VCSVSKYALTASVAILNVRFKNRKKFDSSSVRVDDGIGGTVAALFTDEVIVFVNCVSIYNCCHPICKK
jgi:hypothetical protein